MALEVEVTLFVPSRPSNVRKAEAAEARRLLKGAKIPFREVKHAGFDSLLLIVGRGSRLGLPAIRRFVNDAVSVRPFIRRPA